MHEINRVCTQNRDRVSRRFYLNLIAGYQEEARPVCQCSSHHYFAGNQNQTQIRGLCGDQRTNGRGIQRFGT